MSKTGKLNQIWEAFLKRLEQEVRLAYGDRLVTLAIFGSVARESATPESDVDLLIVATDLPRGRMKRVSEFEQVETSLKNELEIMAENGIQAYLSPIFKTPDEVEAGSPLFLDMIFDVLIRYDRENFFKNFLEGFKRRLDALGAKRIVQGDRWYWDLKPDYKPGDVIKL